MKKIGIFSVALLLSVVAFSNVTKENNKTSVADLESSTTDFMNEKSNVKKVALRNASSGNNAFKASKIYFQTASDSEGYEYLRFAAALRGAYSKVSFTRKIAGVEDKTDDVTTLYKGIAANGKVSFTNGDELVGYDVTSTKNYYWACYTIRFTSDSTYKDKDVTITLNVDDKYSDSRTISLNNAKNYVEDKNINLSFDQYQNYANLYGDHSKFSYDLVNKQFAPSGYEYVHGACNDLDNPRYAYFSMNAGENKTGIVAKYDFETNKVVGYSKPYVVSKETTWTDNANVFFYNGKIYIITSQGTFVSVKASDITGNGVGEITQGDTSLNFKLNKSDENNLSGIKSVAYSKEKDKFAVYTNNTMYIYDGKLNLEKTLANTGGFQTIYSDGERLYGFIKQEETVETVKDGETLKQGTYYDAAIIKTYSWDGTLISKTTYGSKDKPIGDVYTVNRVRCSNLQNMIMYNGKLFITRLVYVGYTNMPIGAYLYEFKTTSLEKHSNITVGEYVETNTKTNFVANELVARYKESGCSYLQGVTTDGDYIYYAFTDSNNTKARLVRSNPITGEWVSATNFVTIATDAGSADAGKIFYYNNNIWVTKRNSKTVFEVNKDTLVETGESLTFDKMPENLKNAAYDKFNDRLVLLGVSGALYTYDKNSKAVSKLADAKGFSGIGVSNLFANDDYIYVTYTTNGIKGVKTSIFDFDGNLIKQVAIEDTTNICPSTNSFNTQGLIDYKGVGIIIGLSWEGTYSGGYIYSAKMN